MSEYTPTTEELREAAHNRAFFPLFRDRAEFDRWLAAHDAEVRAGVVAEEPEWEYRVAGDGGYRTTPGSLDHAMKCVVGDDRIERRTKEIPAGPWVPVKQEGAETDD